MTLHYQEDRVRSNQSSETMLADIMRHYHARQHLGKAVIVSPDPAQTLLQAERHWAKLSRELQKRRGFTTNAIEILKYTYTIAAMQHVVFSTQPPEYHPDAQLYILQPAELGETGLCASTIYLTQAVAIEQLGGAIDRMMPSGLVVDYTGSLTLPIIPHLLPRHELEAAVERAWLAFEQYLAARHVWINQVMTPGTDAMEDAVDRLLGADVPFLAEASVFQRALDLARPLVDTPKVQRDRYEAAIMLAHRVQTFSSGGFSTKFLHTYSKDDFLLNDAPLLSQTDRAGQIQWHLAAGRHNLARALIQGRGGYALASQ